LLRLARDSTDQGGGKRRSGINRTYLVTDRYIECAIVRFGLDSHFAGIGEFDGISDQIDQNVLQAPALAAALRPQNACRSVHKWRNRACCLVGACPRLIRFYVRLLQPGSRLLLEGALINPASGDRSATNKLGNDLEMEVSVMI
jgi:hypothetical protein